MQLLTEAKRGCQVPWTWSYGWLWAARSECGNHATRRINVPNLMGTEPSLQPQGSVFSCAPMGFLGLELRLLCLQGRYIVTKSSSWPGCPRFWHCNMMLTSPNTTGFIHPHPGVHVTSGWRKDRPVSIPWSHYDFMAGRCGLLHPSTIPKASSIAY